LQAIVHAAVPPQLTLHVVDPSHAIVHPPFGQSTTHELLPWQLMVEPVSRLTLQVLPPAQVTWLFTPAVRLH
jgi:hypothetical protein